MFTIVLIRQHRESRPLKHPIENRESHVGQSHPLSLMLAGATILQCLATLSAPIVRPDNAHWLSMEGVVVVKEDGGQEKEETCFFSYFRENVSETVPPGRYCVVAMVCSTLKSLPLLPFVSLTAIVSGYGCAGATRRFTLQIAGRCDIGSSLNVIYVAPKKTPTYTSSRLYVTT